MSKRVALEKTFKPHWVWAIAFGSAIGWGSFVLPAEWMEMAGPAGVIIGLAVGAAIMSLIGISAGNLVRVFPVSGGAFTYSYLTYGRRHAFVCGWFLILGYAAIVALNASAFALMFRFLAPGFSEQGFLYAMAGWDVYIPEIAVASVLLIAFAWINVRGADVSGQVQFWFCVLLLGAAGILTIGMLMSSATTLPNLTPGFQPKVSTWAAIASIVAIAPWAYVGFDTVPQAAEEFNFPANKATTLIVGALFVAVVHYSIMIVATGVGMPWQSLVERHEIWGTGYVVKNVLGVGGMALLALALTMGIFTGLIGFYISTSRLMFAMGRAKALPSVFGKLHKTHHTPYAGIIFVCIICLTAPWFGRSVLLWIVDMSAVGVSIAFLYYSLAAYKLFHWSAASVGSGLSNEISPGKKLIAGASVICSVGVLALLIVPGSPGQLGVQSWVALIIWAVLGLIIYAVSGGEYRSLSRDELNRLILGEQAEKLKAVKEALHR